MLTFTYLEDDFVVMLVINTGFQNEETPNKE